MEFVRSALTSNALMLLAVVAFAAYLWLKRTFTIVRSRVPDTPESGNPQDEIHLYGEKAVISQDEYAVRNVKVSIMVKLCREACKKAAKERCICRFHGCQGLRHQSLHQKSGSISEVCRLALSQA